jgi:SNF family Na+-dependent transporter
MNDATPLSAPGIFMIVVLVVCFVAIVALVITLPVMQNGFRRLFHPRSGHHAHPRTV